MFEEKQVKLMIMSFSINESAVAVMRDFYTKFNVSKGRIQVAIPSFTRVYKSSRNATWREQVKVRLHSGENAWNFIKKH